MRDVSDTFDDDDLAELERALSLDAGEDVEDPDTLNEQLIEAQHREQVALERAASAERRAFQLETALRDLLDAINDS